MIWKKWYWFVIIVILFMLILPFSRREHIRKYYLEKNKDTLRPYQSELQKVKLEMGKMVSGDNDQMLSNEKLVNEVIERGSRILAEMKSKKNELADEERRALEYWWLPLK